MLLVARESGGGDGSGDVQPATAKTKLRAIARDGVNLDMATKFLRL